MYDIVAQTVIAFFLVAYLALFIALMWWALSARIITRPIQVSTASTFCSGADIQKEHRT